MFRALAFAVRDRLAGRMVETRERVGEADAKQAFFLTMEYAGGKSLRSHLRALGIENVALSLLSDMGWDAAAVLEAESDMPLGDGAEGYGAAEALESLTAMNFPVTGYGLQYEFGAFRQEIHNGFQKEKPGLWDGFGSPWLIARPEEACLAPVYGRIEEGFDRHGNYCPRWVDWQVILGIPADMPLSAPGSGTVNCLRLFSAHPSNDFAEALFTNADYFNATDRKIADAAVSKVWVPSGAFAAARERRLLQEYFLAACAIRDIMRGYAAAHDGFEQFPDKAAIHLNGVSTSIAIAELMRALVDEHSVPWDAAWEITQSVFTVTRYDRIVDLAEQWPVSLFESVLPRHAQIVYEINRRFLDDVTVRWPGDLGRLRRMSFFDEGDEKRLRLAHVALTGCHAAFGISDCQSESLVSRVAPDFHEMFSDRFFPGVNGVSPRRWVLGANPDLGALITRTIGAAWLHDARCFAELEPWALDGAFQESFQSARRAAKVRFAQHAHNACRVALDAEALFDVSSGGVHERKRPLLHAMGIVYAYLRIVEDGLEPPTGHVHIFSGKAVPGDWVSKQGIKLIHCLADVINADPRVQGRLAVAFAPDHDVSLEEMLVAAADLSEHLAPAGSEASALRAARFAMNGAVLIATPDNPAAEVGRAAGSENYFLFGGSRADLETFQASHGHNVSGWIEQDVRVRRVLDALHSDRFCPDAPGELDWVWNVLVHGGDRYFHLADLSSYLDCQEAASEAYASPRRWREMAIRSVARVGCRFANAGYGDQARNGWGIAPFEA